MTEDEDPDDARLFLDDVRLFFEDARLFFDAIV